MLYAQFVSVPSPCLGFLFRLRRKAKLEKLHPNQVWQAVLGNLEVQVSRPSFSTWLKPTIGLSLENSRMLVGTPSTFHSKWLQTRMSSIIESALAQVIGYPVTVSFEISVTDHSPQKPSSDLINTSSPKTYFTKPSSHLNPKYTLDSFVVGGSNNLAFAAAKAVSSSPGFSYNPLFLYGGVGLGKTHLLQGIGRAASEKGLTSLYVSSEQFTNEFIGSIQSRKTRAFRDKFRSPDLLLIDDIQFIAGKEAIQEGFFHTFNDLHNANRQIVIACDRPSSSLIDLEERLVSRFQWGLSADIQKPDQETRLAILASKAGDLGASIPIPVLELIADSFQSSIRELEGALNRVFAYSQLTQRPLSIEVAYQSLGDLMHKRRSSPPSLQTILETVCLFYGVDLASLASGRKDKSVIQARHVSAYLLREIGNLPLKQIGAALGNRDYTTIRHSWTKISTEKDENKKLREDLLYLSSSLIGNEIE